MSFAEPPPPYMADPTSNTTTPGPPQNHPPAVGSTRDVLGSRQPGRAATDGMPHVGVVRTPTADALPLQPPYNTSDVPSQDTALARISEGTTAPSQTTDSHQRRTSAAQYFQSRPAARSTILTHRLTVRPNSLPSDFGYPAAWASRDVTPQDWETFVGFLVPHNGGAGGDGKRLGDARKREIGEVLAQWNDGFFRPRSIDIVVEGVSEPTRRDSYSSGSSTTSYHHSPYGQHHAPSSTPSLDGTPLPPRPGYGSGSGTASMSSKDRWKEKLNKQGVKVDSNSIKWGDRFSLDSRKIKIGGFEVGEKGIFMSGKHVDVGELLNGRARGSGHHGGYMQGGHGAHGAYGHYGGHGRYGNHASHASHASHGSHGSAYGGHHPHAPSSGPSPPPGPQFTGHGYGHDQSSFSLPPQVSGTTGPQGPSYSPHAGPPPGSY